MCTFNSEKLKCDLKLLEFIFTSILAHDRNKSLYMIFQQHPYKTIWGRYKLVILINRQIEIPIDYMGSELHKEFVEILGVESKTSRSKLYH